MRREPKFSKGLSVVLLLAPQEIPAEIGRHLELSRHAEAIASTPMVLPSMVLVTNTTLEFTRQTTMDLLGTLSVTVRHRNPEIDSRIVTVIDT